jgi:riboflavin biosynthesis pyrimidine reductase
MSVDGKILGDWEPERVRLLLESDLIKELRVTIKPVIMGGYDAASITGSPKQDRGFFLTEDRKFRLKEMKEEQGEAHLHYVRDRREKS